MKKNQIRKSVAALAMAVVVGVSLLGYGCGSKSASTAGGVSGDFTGTAKGMGGDVTVTLTLELKNTGNVDYSDLRVTDPSLGDVFTNQQLKAGESLTLEKEITVPATAEYQFTVTATDEGGSEMSVVTEPLTVTAVAPEDALTLTVTATADRTEVFEQPGLVRFTLEIANTSQVDATDVVVSHGDTQIYTFASIPAGETRTLSRDTALSMAGKFRFTVTAKDPLESTLTFESNEIQIAFSVPTPAPATPPRASAEPHHGLGLAAPARTHAGPHLQPGYGAADHGPQRGDSAQNHPEHSAACADSCGAVAGSFVCAAAHRHQTQGRPAQSQQIRD